MHVVETRFIQQTKRTEDINNRKLIQPLSSIRVVLSSPDRMALVTSVISKAKSF